MKSATSVENDMVSIIYKKIDLDFSSNHNIFDLKLQLHDEQTLKHGESIKSKDHIHKELLCILHIIRLLDKAIKIACTKANGLPSLTDDL